MRGQIGRKIGEGACAEIFEWDDGEGDGGKVIKLARRHLDRQAMLEEFHHNQVAWNLGLPVPRAFDLIEVGGRAGILYERVYGESAMDRLIHDVLAASGGRCEGGFQGRSLPRLFDDFRRFARVLSRIHAHSAEHLPLQREKIKENLRRVDALTSDEKAMVTRILDSLPEKRQLCHGDPNPGNLMFCGDDVTVIDWMDASLGAPEGDVADLVVLVRYGALPPHLSQDVAERLDSLREQIIVEFLSEYERLMGVAYEDVDAWIVPMAARRLAMGALRPEEKMILAGEIRRRLESASS